MKTKHFFLTVSMLCVTMMGFGQTWNIGYPNEEDVVASLSNGTLIIEGTGDTKDYGYIDGEFSYSPWYYSLEVESVIIKAGITRVGDALFQHCRNLHSVVLGEDITSIGEWTFFNCPSLLYINIPVSVNSIAMDAFGACKGLLAVFVSWEDPNSVEYGLYIFEAVNTSMVKLHVPVGKREVYQNHEVWGEFTIIDDGKKEDDGDDSSFAFLSNLTTNVGDFDSSFISYKYAYSLTVPESVATINLIATPSGSASVSGDGQKALSVGENNFEIVVTSKDGNYRNTYTVKVIRREMDYVFDFINATSHTFPVSYYDVVQGRSVTVNIIDGYKLKYRLTTGRYSGNLPLNFDLSLNGSQKTFNTSIPVNSNSVYEFVFDIELKNDNPVSVTTHYNGYGQPSHTTINNYGFHPCNLIVSDGSYTLHTANIDMPWTLENVSVTDVVYVGKGSLSSIQEAESQTTAKVYPTVTSGIIHIDNPADETVEVYGTSGSLLLTTSASIIDISGYPQGIYLVKAGNTVVKVIKK